MAHGESRQSMHQKRLDCVNGNFYMGIIMTRFTYLNFVLGLPLMLALMTICFSVAEASQMRESIAAIVNDEPITTREVNERLALIMASSNLPDQAEIRERLKQQVLNQLVEEQLKLQEAERLEISVGEEDIKNGITAVAQSNGMEYDAFIARMKKENVKIRSLRRQVRSQISWSQVIAKELRPRIRVTDQDVNSELERMRANIGKTEYLLAEIYLPFSENNPPAKIQKFADNLVAQIVQKKAPFQRVAQQFSQSAAAARGGDIGWVQEGQLPQALDEKVQDMDNGSLSKPIKTLSGYHILLLRDRRTATEDTLPSREQIRQNLTLERIERLQRRHLIDLKTTSFIDVRV